MDFANRGLDQPLYMTSVMWSSWRTVAHIDAILLAGARQSARVEFPGVVDVKHVRYAEHGVNHLDGALFEPLRFGQSPVPQRHANRSSRGVFKRNVEAGYDACCDVD
ncbi:MAG: hypothetical protein VW935_08220 [Novosphingobium sp.]